MKTSTVLELEDITEACRNYAGLPGAGVRFTAKLAGGELSELKCTVTGDLPQPSPAPPSVVKLDVT